MDVLLIRSGVTVTKHPPQGMYHDPGRKVYRMVTLGKQPDIS